MILGLQIFSIIFSLVMVYFAYVHYQKGDLNGIEVLAWTAIWFVTIIVVIFPTILQTFTQTFSISRPFDMMVVGGFSLVTPMIYMAFVRTKRLEKKLEDFIRSESLKDMPRKDEKVPVKAK